MEILTGLFGILGIIILGIIVIAFRKRNLISQMLNATMALKQSQKTLEKELYDKEFVKQMPDMIKAKVAKDMEKKLNKKSFAEKLGEASKELTKNAKAGGMEHKGLDSVMDDLNVFSGNNQNQLKNADFLKREDSKGKNFDFSDIISNTSMNDLAQARKDTDGLDDKDDNAESGKKRPSRRR
jgi:hypothetical protein